MDIVIFQNVRTSEIKDGDKLHALPNLPIIKNRDIKTVRIGTSDSFTTDFHGQMTCDHKINS